MEASNKIGSHISFYSNTFLDEPLLSFCLVHSLELEVFSQFFLCVCSLVSFHRDQRSFPFFIMGDLSQRACHGIFGVAASLHRLCERTQNSSLPYKFFNVCRTTNTTRKKNEENVIMGLTWVGRWATRATLTTPASPSSYTSICKYPISGRPCLPFVLNLIPIQSVISGLTGGCGRFFQEFAIVFWSPTAKLNSSFTHSHEYKVYLHVCLKDKTGIDLHASEYN